jgi:hypothetical protein
MGAATVSGAYLYLLCNLTVQHIRRTIGSEWVSPFTAVGGVVINGNQTTTLNGAKIFNTGIPLIINSGAKLAGANSLTLGGDFINNEAYLPQLAPLLCKWDDEPSYSGFYYNRCR